MILYKYKLQNLIPKQILNVAWISLQPAENIWAEIGWIILGTDEQSKGMFENFKTSDSLMASNTRRLWVEYSSLDPRQIVHSFLAAL